MRTRETESVIVLVNCFSNKPLECSLTFSRFSGPIATYPPSVEITYKGWLSLTSVAFGFSPFVATSPVETAFPLLLTGGYLANRASRSSEKPCKIVGFSDAYEVDRRHLLICFWLRQAYCFTVCQTALLALSAFIALACI